MPAKRGYYCPENMERLARAERLAEKYHCTVAGIALSWMFHQKLDVFPILSGSSARRYQEALQAADIPLTEKELAWLDLR